MSSSWDAYLHAPRLATEYAACRSACSSAFNAQRDQIRGVLETISPRTVACLGAGGLNDIPYRILIDAGVTLYLVDWIPDSIDYGIGFSIIDRSENGAPCCVYCEPAVACPQRYCRHFRMPAPSTTAVCDAFVPANVHGHLSCAAFERADEPRVLYEDVTAGYATAFARAVSAEEARFRSWGQALSRARRLASRARGQCREVAIPSDSVDLVTSSMVLSQFEHEPYTFFSTRVAARLGRPDSSEAERLLPAVDELRSALLANQIERHLDEIHRILAPDGRCYLSFEMFHGEEHGRWFSVPGMTHALDAIGKRFHFRFDIIPESQVLTRFATNQGTSLAWGLVLEPRKRRSAR